MMPRYSIVIPLTMHLAVIRMQLQAINFSLLQYLSSPGLYLTKSHLRLSSSFIPHQDLFVILVLHSKYQTLQT